MAKPRMKIKSFTILDWTVPMFGNTHSYPYFKSSRGRWNRKDS